MKKMLLAMGMLCAACLWANAEVNDAAIQQSRDRVEKIRVVRNNLQGVSTGDASIDGAKNAAVNVCEEVIKSGEQLADLYAAMNEGKKPVKEVLELSAQLANEGLETAELAKKIEEASKASKSLKNPKAALNAGKLIKNATEASKLTGEEVAFEVQLAKEMADMLKAKK